MAEQEVDDDQVAVLLVLRGEDGSRWAGWSEEGSRQSACMPAHHTNNSCCKARTPQRSTTPQSPLPAHLIGSGHDVCYLPHRHAYKLLHLAILPGASRWLGQCMRSTHMQQWTAECRVAARSSAPAVPGHRPISQPPPRAFVAASAAPIKQGSHQGLRYKVSRELQIVAVQDVPLQPRRLHVVQQHETRRRVHERQLVE